LKERITLKREEGGSESKIQSGPKEEKRSTFSTEKRGERNEKEKKEGD